MMATVDAQTNAWIALLVIAVIVLLLMRFDKS